MLRTMSSLCVPNVDSAPSSMPNLWQIIHFPQANALVPGLNLLRSLLITFLVPLLESTMPPSDENVCGTSPVGLLNYAISVDSLEILHDSNSVSNTAHSAGKT